ncbi:hypothetical protein CGRA01v4_06253 [Colletotrichum graminicola]|nr:hypothetical protein CGRA01v4_06253 [Colletotrichum graminicola]
MARRGSQAIEIDSGRIEYVHSIRVCRGETCEPCQFRDKSGSLSSSARLLPSLGVDNRGRPSLGSSTLSGLTHMVFSMSILFISLQPSVRHLFLSCPDYSLRKLQPLSASTVESVSILIFSFYSLGSQSVCDLHCVASAVHRLPSAVWNGPFSLLFDYTPGGFVAALAADRQPLAV